MATVVKHPTKNNKIVIQQKECCYLRLRNVCLTYPTTFRMSSKGAYGIGDVCLEPLRDVWSNSQVRINNKLDHSFDPLPSKQGKSGHRDQVGRLKLQPAYHSYVQIPRYLDF